jgi:hypothetical protein
MGAVVEVVRRNPREFHPVVKFFAHSESESRLGANPESECKQLAELEATIHVVRYRDAISELLRKWPRGDGARVWDVPDASAFVAVLAKIVAAAGKGSA